TPNTLTSSFDFGGREVVFEVRGLMTGGEGTPPMRMGGGGRGRGGRGGPGAPGGPPPAEAPPPTQAPAPGTPAALAAINVQIGDLFYGTEGWASMSDQGFIAYKGDSNEVIMEERPTRGP